MKRHTPLRPGPGPRRRTAVRKRNAVRLRKRREEAYGEHSGWVCRLACHVCEVNGLRQTTPTVPAHCAKTRGAGGKAKHLANLCAHHESLWHSMGARTFDNHYGVCMRTQASKLWARSPYNDTREEAEE